MGLFRRLSSAEQEKAGMLNNYLTEVEIDEVIKSLKRKDISLSTYNLSFMDSFIAINPAHQYNDKIRKKVFQNFSKVAFEVIPKFIAPNIMDVDLIKQTALLQVVSNERIHMLLIGDPGTGKTKIIHSSSNLSPINSFGLGSGTSGVGLALTMKGKEMSRGLLPLAHNGVCALDELNLMKKEDSALLLNAMESGFITYVKGGNNIRLDTNVKVLATANPKGDKFVGKNILSLKKQMPFDSALLTRFHLVFLLRKPGHKKFMKITENLINNAGAEIKEYDLDFIKEYIKYAKENIGEVRFDKQFKDKVSNSISKIKKNEDKYLIDVSPRLVIGLIRLAKASARLELRDYVIERDVDRAINILDNSLVY